MKNCIDTALFGRICDKNCDGDAIFQLVALVVKTLSIGIGILAVLGVIISGIVYLTSAGNADRQVKAKKRLVNVAIGLAIYSVMFAIIWFLLPDFDSSDRVDSSCSKPKVTQYTQQTKQQDQQTQTQQQNQQNQQSNQQQTQQQNQQNQQNQTQQQTNNSSSQSTGHYDAKHNVLVQRPGLSYILHIPDGATDNMPLVIFLHGQGETGYASQVAALPTVKAMDSAAEAKNFIAIAPVQPDDGFGYSNVINRNKRLIDEVVRTYKIDKNRIYLIGFSMGAIHTWCLVNTYPTFFRAAVPISMSPYRDSCRCNGSTPSASNFAHTRIWAMAGGAELDYVPGMREFVSSINKAGGSARFSTPGNYAHTEVQSHLNHSSIFSWLLSFK